MKKVVWGALVLWLFLVGVGGADSIWKNGSSTSPYSTQKTYKVGDIVYVVILESTSALSKAETNTDIKDELAVSFQHTIDSLATAIDTDFSFTPKIQNVYDGSGKTTRSASIQAKVAARVTKLLDNGNIKIVGKHLIEVNGEEQEITITGVVRTKDISQQSNAVYSYQVANAKIVVKGSGMVAEAEQPGWLTRIVNWLF